MGGCKYSIFLQYYGLENQQFEKGGESELSPHIADRRGYERLEQVLQTRLEKYEPKPKTGLWVDEVDLTTWRNSLRLERD